MFKTSFNQIDSLLIKFFANKSEKTKKLYMSDLKDFSRYMRGDDVSGALVELLSRPSTQAELTVLHYLSFLRDKQLSGSTINRRLSTIRSLVRTASQSGIISWRLNINNLPVPDPLKSPKISGVEKKRLYSALKDNSKTAKTTRDYAILRLINDINISRSEIVSFRLENLDLKENRIWFTRKKRRISKKLTKLCAEALHAWIGYRGRKPGLLFHNFDHAGKGAGLSETSVYRIVRNAGELAGIELTPRQLGNRPQKRR